MLIFNTWNSIPDSYDQLKKLAFAVLSLFGSTYSCEQSFSSMYSITSKLRNWLIDENLESYLKNKFQHIHDDDEIPPENKFQYLVQATVNGSRARDVVQSFMATAANYAKAVESLKARFGRDDLLVEVYARELLKLIISVQKQEKISMTSMYDKL
ncbi:uncharacterized protein TNCV_577251 [Trichonephila clavipes]|nr:uncharacterized protein TNCV_577251 [Trichonephila clavipes]